MLKVIDVKAAQEKRIQNYERDKHLLEVIKTDKGYQVSNSMKQTSYTISKLNGQVICDCPDFTYKCKDIGIQCKHIYAVYQSNKNNIKESVNMNNINTNNKFNPQRHLIKVKGQDYLEVKFRLHWCRQEHPQWDINPVTTTIDLERGIAVARCDIYDEQGKHIAAGEKMEYKKNFHDYLEKAHTGAIGRALSVAGYGTLQCAGEMDEGRPVDAPVDNSKPQTENSSRDNNGKASEKQVQYLQRLCEQLNVNTKKDFTAISKAEASLIIEEMKKKLNNNGKQPQ